MDVIMRDVDKVQPKKKLKQTRLPFQVVNPKIKIGEHTAKKRKLSDSVFADESKYIKYSRSNSEESSPDVVIISSSPSEKLFETQERDVNQPEITNFFKTHNDDHSKSSDAFDDKINKCYVDLSNSKVDEQFNLKSHDGTKIDSQSSDKKIDSSIKEVFNLKSEDKENILTTEKSDDNVFDLTLEDEDVNSIKELDTAHEDAKVNFLQQIGLNDDLNTSFNKIESKDSHIDSTELTPVKNDSNITKQLTPKQLQRKLEFQKKQEEKERQRQEKQKKQQEEKEKRLKQKQELEEQKKKERDEKEEQRKREKEEKEEQKRKEREEKEEQKRKEREEKERKRQAEIIKKEQEKLELELKKKKAAEAFAKFFVSKENETKKTEENVGITNTTNFMPFQVKSDMRMAPIFRTNFTEEQKLQFENKLNSEASVDKLYLQELKRGKSIGKSEKTWVIENEADVICVDDEIGTENVIQLVPTPQKMRVKLLQFHENRRPPYWGTWRKKSALIKPRRPLGTDSKIFDYDIDSDDEWEEEEPGESLHGSDDEKDSDCDEKENEYEIDNEFMVPHGYLSEEEIIDGEDDCVQFPDSPDSHKAKLKALEIEFEAERKEKTERLKPRLFGCIWSDKENKQPNGTPEQIKRFMYNNQILFSDPVIILSNDINEFVTSPSSSKTCTSPKKKRLSVPEKYIPDLIRLLHGNTNGKLFLFKEFKAFLNTVETDLLISKKRFDLLLKEIASWMPCPDEGPMHNKYCWYVKKDVRKKYECNVSIPNCWKYILSKKSETTEELKE